MQAMDKLVACLALAVGSIWPVPCMAGTALQLSMLRSLVNLIQCGALHMHGAAQPVTSSAHGPDR